MPILPICKVVSVKGVLKKYKKYFQYLKSGKALPISEQTYQFVKKYANNSVQKDLEYFDKINYDLDKSIDERELYKKRERIFAMCVANHGEKRVEFIIPTFICDTGRKIFELKNTSLKKKEWRKGELIELIKFPDIGSRRKNFKIKFLTNFERRNAFIVDIPKQISLESDKNIDLMFISQF